MVQFLFPFGCVKSGSNIVLYGAGNAGIDFYHQIAATNYCKVVLWADQRYEWYQKAGLEVNAPEKILEIEYDCIVVAIVNGEPAVSFLRSMGVEMNKIIWSSHYFINKNHMTAAFDRLRQDTENQIVLRKMEADELLSSERLDIMIRYLLCRDIHNHVQNKNHLSLYARFFLVLHGAEEPMNVTIISTFSEYSSKTSVSSFIDSFKTLTESMEANGFLKEHYLPLDAKGSLINAAHRYAAALALEQKVWTGQINGFGDGFHMYDMSWFEKNSFSEADKMRILRAFADLYPACTLFVLFGPCIEQWDFIKGFLGKRINITGSVDIDLEHDYIAFENIFHDFYQDLPYEQRKRVLREHFLQHPLRIRVCLLTDEMNKGSDVYANAAALKRYIIEYLFMDYPPEIQPLLIYAAGDARSVHEKKAILLSPNNLKYQGLRLSRQVSPTLDSRLDALRTYLLDNGVPLCDIALCGDTLMELFGMDSADSLEFTFKSKYRKDMNRYFSNLPLNMHILPIDYHQLDDNVVYDDDVLVEDHNFHFVYRGFKFVNLDILFGTYIYREEYQKPRLIELLFEYHEHFGDKQYLRMSFEKEILRQYKNDTMTRRGFAY